MYALSIWWIDCILHHPSSVYFVGSRLAWKYHCVIWWWHVLSRIFKEKSFQKSPTYPPYAMPYALLLRFRCIEGLNNQILIIGCSIANSNGGSLFSSFLFNHPHVRFFETFHLKIRAFHETYCHIKCRFSIHQNHTVAPFLYCPKVIAS